MRASGVSRPPRPAAVAAADRLAGGTGAVPRREAGPVDFRIRNAAFDVMCGVRPSAADRELALDWALDSSHVTFILKVISDYERDDAAMARAAILAQGLS